MPFAGTFPSSAALLLLLLLLLWAEAAQRVEGLVRNNGYYNATATGAAEICMCYQGSAFDDVARLLQPGPCRCLAGTVAVLLPGPAMLLEPILPAGAAPAHEKCSSWPPAKAKPWFLLFLGVTIQIVVLLSGMGPFPLSRRVHGNGDSPLDADSDGGELCLFYCAICMETVPGTLKFSVGSCGHEFCSSCIAQYVAAKLGENLTRVGCPDPGCNGVGAVEPESCRGIISRDLLDRWGFLLCESAFGAGKMYCPYRECSAPLLMDVHEAIKEAECPYCHRLFCARCAVPWHADIGCSEFQQLRPDERGRDDLLLRQLACQQRWQRCPNCQMYVEKSEGCNYIKCRCGYSFCYRCASLVSAETHYCNKCKR